jgi:DMSO/TMAO reductase YedYZ molybdopterin-dependent catalytic subunit
MRDGALRRGGLLLALAMLLGVLSAAPASRAQEAAVVVAGAVSRPLTLTAEQLRAYPQGQVEVEYVARGGLRRSVFSGPLLWDVLRDAGVPEGREALRQYVVAVGADGYEVVLALAELHPEFAGQAVLLALERDGQQLSPEEGPVRLVVPQDRRGGRHVYQLVRLTVRVAAGD